MYDRGNSEFSDRPERCQGAPGDRNVGEADLIKETVQAEIERVNKREPNKVGECLTKRLSEKPQRTSDLKLLAHGGAR